MKNIMMFSENVARQFENDNVKLATFGELMLDSAHRNYVKYSKDETDNAIRKMFNQICGINFATADARTRRQAWRAHGKEAWSLIEDVIVDRMASGWDSTNAKFMDYVDDRNIAYGDKNEFYADDTSLLVVSRFAGNHHDIVRQKITPGKAFSIDTSWYVIKVYADYELFQLGKIDFAAMVDRMYASIEQTRYAELFTAFMSLDSYLPSDMKLQTAVADATKDTIIDHIEAVKAASGKDVILVGARPAIQKLQGTVNYALFSESMKEEKNKVGILGNWEGYECLALSRVNKAGTRTSVFSTADNKKIFILPIDPNFKPIKRVNEGDVIYTESGMDGNGNMDMTVTADIRYQEGIGIVVDELFGEIVATN